MGRYVNGEQMVDGSELVVRRREMSKTASEQRLWSYG